MAVVGRQRWWLAALLIAILLAACGGNADGGQPTAAAAAQPTVVVLGTVEPSQESPAVAPTTAAPTTVPPTATPPAPLAALVNGQYIFLAEYESRVAQYEQALLQQGLDATTSEGQAQLEQARLDVLEGLIDGVLIEQGAAMLGVSLSDEEIENQIDADIEAGGGQTAFDEWLQVTGQTREDYGEMLGQSMLSQRVLDAVTADVPAEIEQVHARHIMVESEEEAREILAMLQEGSDFVALARERSVDLATKDNGGDLGWFPRGLVAAELETAAFALQPGQVSDVVRLGDGYHVVQVVEREPARPLSAEMQVDLKLSLFGQWLADLRAAAAIERFVGQ